MKQNFGMKFWDESPDLQEQTGSYGEPETAVISKTTAEKLPKVQNERSPKRRMKQRCGGRWSLIPPPIDDATSLRLGFGSVGKRKV